jgi:two-component system phosphate regulon sensor histidine kinase PhoR
VLSFKRKIALADALLFALFIICFAAVARTAIQQMTFGAFEKKMEALAADCAGASSLDALFERLKQRDEFFFHQIQVFDSKGFLLFDSHPDDRPAAPLKALNEAHETLAKGASLVLSYSPRFDCPFYFAARPFLCSGGQYLVRGGIPEHEVGQFVDILRTGWIAAGAILLLFYSLFTWGAIHYLTRPIEQILDAVRPYDGERRIPRIGTGHWPDDEEFRMLARTINLLMEKVEKQVGHAEEQQREIEGILESLAEGIIAFDPSGKITFVNEVAAHMLSTHGAVPKSKESAPLGQGERGAGGDRLHLHESSHEADEAPIWSKGETAGSFKLVPTQLLGKQLREIPGDLARRGGDMVLHTLQTAETLRQGWVEKGDRQLFLDLIAMPLAHHRGAVWVLQDKTADYKFLQMGKDFIANASHELRTPITIIKGFAETLADHPELPADVQREIMDKIFRTSCRLETLAKSLLSLTHIENTRVEDLQPTDLLAISQKCRDMVLAAHPEAEIAIVTSGERPVVRADPDLVDLALSNLLDNAIKYSTRHAKIRLLIDGRQEAVALKVSDQGIGIPAVDLPHIFDRFYTVDKARSRKSGGAGLGLSIVKTIMDRHQGQVSALSKLGKGSTFTLLFPRGSSA